MGETHGLQAHEMYNCGDPEGSAMTFITNFGSIIFRGPFKKMARGVI